jgi:hypothetical protein
VPLGRSKKIKMIPVQTSNATHSESNANFALGLESEAGELEALNVGLKRHVAAWRSAHDSAVARLSGVLARMDSILERIEQNSAASKAD